jgi:glycosidase
VVLACKPQHGGGPDGGPSDSGMVMGCPVTFTHRAVASASSVVVVGEWNQFDRLAQPLKDMTGAGTWTGTFEIPPGRWAYAYLENGAEAVDAEATYVRYHDDRPWSGLKVADCSKGLLSVQPHTLTNANGSFSVGLAAPGIEKIDVSLALPDGTARTSTLNVSGDGATYSVSGLSPGKYTAKLTPSGGTESLLLPFWVEAEHFSFRDSPVYMVLTDRFRNGDPSNDMPGSATAGFRGGDLQGVEAAIKEGYFDALNVKAIWVSPWQTQPNKVYSDDGTHTISGYHGYWPVKAREVDARFGGAAALKSMVQEAHRHGIRIVMDAVINHVHADHEYFMDPAKKSWFRTGCICGSSPACGWDPPSGLSCLFRDYMPDVNWTNNDAADQFVDDILWWMEEFDLDGLRVDAVKQVEDSAITNLTNAVRARFQTAGTDYFMFGETFTGDPGLVKRYIGPYKLDAQLDFPLYLSTPEAVFARDDQGLQQVRSATLGTLSDFGDAPMVDFIGNQDVARFITKADPANRDRQGSQWDNLPGAPAGQVPYDRLFLAFADLMTIPGVPLIYYGDEYGEFGGADPDNRHMMNQPATFFPEQRNQLERMKGLLAARAKLKGLRRGPYVDLWCNTEAWGQGSGNLYAYARTDADPHQSAVVVLNITANTWTQVTVNFPASLQWTSGTVREELSGTDHPFSGSTVTVDVPARGAVILSLK